jgi:hypothetical protein
MDCPERFQTVQRLDPLTGPAMMLYLPGHLLRPGPEVLCEDLRMPRRFLLGLIPLGGTCLYMLQLEGLPMLIIIIIIQKAEIRMLLDELRTAERMNGGAICYLIFGLLGYLLRIPGHDVAGM